MSTRTLLIVYPYVVNVSKQQCILGYALKYTAHIVNSGRRYFFFLLFIRYLYARARTRMHTHTARALRRNCFALVAVYASLVLTQLDAAPCGPLSPPSGKVMCILSRVICARADEGQVKAI